MKIKPFVAPKIYLSPEEIARVVEEMKRRYDAASKRYEALNRVDPEDEARMVVR